MVNANMHNKFGKFKLFEKLNVSRPYNKSKKRKFLVLVHCYT